MSAEAVSSVAPSWVKRTALQDSLCTRLETHSSSAAAAPPCAAALNACTRPLTRPTATSCSVGWKQQSCQHPMCAQWFLPPPPLVQSWVALSCGQSGLTHHRLVRQLYVDASSPAHGVGDQSGGAMVLYALELNSVSCGSAWFCSASRQK